MDDFFADPSHRPQSFHVSHWCAEPYSQGAWSQLCVGGTPSDRTQLGSKVSDNFIIAGEATSAGMAAMVNGAAETGIYAATQMCSPENSTDSIFSCANDSDCADHDVIVIGAGTAGVFAARKTKELLTAQGRPDASVVLLEARDRIGGRIHTVDMTLPGDGEAVRVDLGATWLQQYPNNIVADIIRTEDTGLEVVPTDFSTALCSTDAGVPPFRDLNRILDAGDYYVSKAMENADTDRSLADVLLEYIDTLPESQRFLAHLSIGGDVVADLGYDLFDTSARHGLEELGVGNDDHYIKQGYGAILEYLSKGLDIRLQTAVEVVNYTNPLLVRLQLKGGQVITAQRCICTTPVAVMRNKTISFVPELPPAHLGALGRIQQGRCEKVLLRFNTRWWPVCNGTADGNGMLRWYDTSRYPEHAVRRSEFPMLLDYVEWLDMTDGLGVPVVMGFCVGKQAVARFHVGTDKEIATNAALAFEKWAWYMKQNMA